MQIASRDFEVSRTVIETGSFLQGGPKLRLGQSAVSRHIQKMGELLGVSLFERTSTGARLTYAESEFVACSSSIFENLKSAIGRAQSLGSADDGILRIGTTSSFSNGPHRALLKTFVRRNPSVRLCFVETERRQVMTMLALRTLDAVISVSDQTGTHGDSFHLSDKAICLTVASDSSLAKRESVSWSEIGNLQLLISAREAIQTFMNLLSEKRPRLVAALLSHAINCFGKVFQGWSDSGVVRPSPGTMREAQGIRMSNLCPWRRTKPLRSL